MIKTSEKIAVENYPWGFRLKTTLYDSMEFSPKKGYRHVTQTIDPKTGKLCAPKKSTYYALLVRYYNDDNHIKTMAFDFNGIESINKGCKFVNENIQYFYGYIRMMAIVDLKANVMYCGSKFEDLKPLYDPFIELCEKGLSNGWNYFSELQLDVEAIKSLEDVNYNPFR